MTTRTRIVGDARTLSGRWLGRAGLACVLAAACGDAGDGTSSTDGTTGAETGASTSSGSDAEASTSSTSETSDTEGAFAFPHGPLRAGVAVEYLADPVGISMAGYGLRTPKVKTPWMDVLNGTRGFYGYMTIKAMVLEVEGERLALVKLPTMSSEDSLTEGTIRKLKEDHGLDFEGRVMTGATHSHHTHARYWRLPQQLAAVGADSPDEEVIDRLTSAFALAIKRAVDDLDEAEWGFGYADDWDPDNLVYRDRRGENNPTYGKDPRLTLFAVRRAGGAPMATLINFGMHGTLFSEDNELLTEDSAGGLEMKFEEFFFAREQQPILGMFIQSGGGDASPGGDQLGHAPPARAELVGEVAAPRVYDLYKSLAWERDATLAVRSRRIDLRYELMGYAELPEFKGPSGIPYTWGGWQCKDDDVTDSDNPETSMEGRPKFCTDIGGLLTSLQQPIPNGQMHQAYVTTARVGNVFMVSLPGEPAYSVIKYLRESMATRALPGGEPIETLAFGYSQDHLLYLTHPDDWYQGGYETEMSLWGPLGAKYIVDRQLEQVDGILAEEDGPVFDSDSEDLSGPSSFEPRGIERSTNAGALTQNLPETIERGQTLRFGWGGGDPSIGSPLVSVEVDPGDGAWTLFPSPSGWPGTGLDNTRYHMLTHYAPNPAPNGQVAETRDHDWFVDWQIPLDFPGARVRLVARGEAFDGQTTAPYEVTSSPVLVQPAASSLLEGTRQGDRVELRFTVAPPPTEYELSYPIGGYRLLDPQA
ncbi:MAG: neutral/alkaline non-lysosomal ceramidase N-terminal domain-containing protein, partial [Myxococcales bacterium]|nr:neutral/alkaline non-lysosomal ceramidase N-terminal domain-containing protein [Myxococcales bacterium]